MSTTFHTAITTGAAANAATINTPLGELDAKLGVAHDADGTLKAGAVDVAAVIADTIITDAKHVADAKVGSLATLTTTAKSSAVAAINELDALIGAAASSSGTIGTSIDTDGTLKAGAVDVAAVIADTIITDAKHVADAKVGSLATLTTTAKSSAVAAINELDALIGAAASSSGSIGTSIDTDGTLKAGAVDVAAVIADGVVSSAKLTATATPSPNLCFDPFNANYAVSANAQDGRFRWYSSGFTREVDADNVFGGYLIRFTGTATGGKQLFMAEMNVKIGDTLSFAVYAKVPTGRSIKLAINFRTTAGGAISQVLSDTVVGNDLPQLITIENQVIPATAAIIYFWISQVSGSGTVDVYSWYAVAGAKIQQLALPGSVLDGQRALAQIISAPSPSGLTERLTNRNLAPDPFFELWEISSTHKQNGSIRWYMAGAALTYNGLDTNNPFGGRTLIHDGSAAAGPKLYLTECRLVAGDKATFGFVVRGTAGETWRLTFATRNSVNATVDAANGPTITLTGGLDLIYVSQATAMTSDVAYIDVYASRVSGSNSLSIYSHHCIRGTSLALDECLLDNYRQRYQSGWVGHRDLVPQPQVGLANLMSWRGAQARLYEAETNRHARIVLIGDSYTAAVFRWAKQLTNLLAANLGGGLLGAGYVSAHSASYGSKATWPKYTSLTRTGTWTQRDATTTPTGKGVDLYDATSTANGDRYDIAGTFSTVVIHYLKQTGGGTFKTSVDGGSNWSADIDTSNAGDLFATATVTGCSNAIRVQANGATVTLLGFELIDTSITNGLAVHQLGYSGGGTAMFATASAAPVWRASMTQLAPDLVIIWLGANEVASVDEYTSRANTKILMDSIRVAMPTVDFLLVSPPEHNTAHTTKFSSYARRMMELANHYPCAAIDMSAYIKYGSADALDLFMDSTHTNQYGGALAGGVIARALEW